MNDFTRLFAGMSKGQFSIDQLELKGFTRSLAELEWLLVALALLFYVTASTPIADRFAYLMATVGYAILVLSFRYLSLFKLETRWRLAIQTWFMVAYITWLLWLTGRTESPLLNLYLLVLIMSSLTLGKSTTVLQVALIVTLYLQGLYATEGEMILSLATLSDLMSKFAPLLLVTYLVTLLSADIDFSRNALRILSETDEMTGLQNRRAFTNTLGREYERAKRHGHNFSILMIDADGLKAANDNHGHAAGDRMIQSIAECLRESLRATDCYARYGGDEFVAYLPNTGDGSAREAAERIRTRVANTSFDVQGQRVTATVSIGIATYPEHGADLDEVTRRADTALYQAKSAGRNRVVMAEL